MRKNYKLIVSIIALILTSLGAFAQEQVEYKDVILDGKPAKLNVATGEITLVNLEKKTIDKQAKDGKNNPMIKTKDSIVNGAPAPKSNDASSDFHIIAEGETLFNIATRYGVSLNELKKANNLQTTLIDKGQTLRVKNLDAYLEASNTGESVSYALDGKDSTSNFHIVKKGESLYSLSKRYNLSVNELKIKNELNTDLIKVGQKLRVRDFGLSNPIYDVSVWTVKKGDTLFSIANKSGTSVEAIKQLNGLTDNTIMIGQILQLK